MSLIKPVSALQRSLLSCCVTAALTLGLATASAENFELPELGSASSVVMTPAQEKRLGQAFMRNIKASEKIIEEPFARDYIERLGKKLAQSSGEQGTNDFHFFIVDNPRINAFAGPGGHIGIFSGLMLTTQSESELAAVLAHEIAHVTQRHLMRAFHQASQLSVPSAAVLLAAVILGAAVGGDAAIATAATGQALLIQKQINFTRSNEKEADRVGINILAESNFDTRAMPVFFERMGRATRTYATELPEFLRTHPVTTNRIADSLSRAEQHPYRQHRDNLHYHLVKNLIRQKTFPNAKEAEKYFSTNLLEGRYSNKLSEHFGLALSLIEQRRYTDARTQVDILLREKPEEVVFIILDARLLSLINKTPKAISSLEDSQTLFPDNYILNMELADLYIKNSQYEDAVSLLKLITLIRPLDDLIYKQLAIAAGKQKDLVAAHAYQSEYLYLNGQVEPAIQQLEIALRQENIDFYLSSKLEARLQALKYEFKLLKDEKNKK